MRLYLHCPNCANKIILKSEAKSRRELASQWGYNFSLNCPHCQYQGYYSVLNVFAETSPNNAKTGAIIGGLIGLIIGPEGALIGSALGGALGYSSDENEKKMVQQFNNSH